MKAANLLRLEQDLRKIPGVRSARVVGDNRPEEIHIVSTGERSPKQMVRDVQSLASAGFGLAIDHRIVSIVELEEAREIRLDEPAPARVPPPPAPQRTASSASSGTSQESSETPAPAPVPASTNGRGRARPALEHVVLASKRAGGWVKVGLRWPDGELTEGAGSAGQSRGARARGATVALHRALEPILDSVNARIDVDEVLIHRVGGAESVSVRAIFYENGTATSVVGSALIQDDVATAAARAFLHAINRKLK